MLRKVLDKNITSEIETGQFRNIDRFLNDKIWSSGSLKDTHSLIKDTVGEDKVYPVIFLDYLLQKYQK